MVCNGRTTLELQNDVFQQFHSFKRIIFWHSISSYFKICSVFLTMSILSTVPMLVQYCGRDKLELKCILHLPCLLNTILYKSILLSKPIETYRYQYWFVQSDYTWYNNITTRRNCFRTRIF